MIFRTKEKAFEIINEAIEFYKQKFRDSLKASQVSKTCEVFKNIFLLFSAYECVVSIQDLKFPAYQFYQSVLYPTNV